MYIFHKTQEKNRPFTTKRAAFYTKSTDFHRLFSFEAIATGAAFRIAVAGVPYVDFTQGAVIPCAVELTFRYATTDSRVYFVAIVFVHHVFKLLFL